jgi:ferredoxin
MPTIHLPDDRSFDAETDERLVRALERNGVDILHRCGGYARCTTCRVQFYAGEPDKMTEAEYNKLAEKGLLNTVRLSCQILCDHDMTVEPLNTMSNTDVSDPGPEPEATITPEPVWIGKEKLEDRG